MRTERGNFWNKRRITTARMLLVGGYGRDAVAERFGLTRTALKEAIARFKLEPPEVRK